MILRKPYGFLIKHFRMIHLVLTALYIYLAIKVNSLLSYYNNFISGKESKLNAIKLVTNYYLIAIIISIIICLIIYALMRYKKKPKLLYLILIILYIAVAIIINIAYNGLDTIYISSLDLKTQRLYRDLLRIIIMFQYISIVFTTIRGLGFDIKKFNFKEDMVDLQLDITDNEEVELTVGNTEGIIRRIRRRIRELKYYYKENKLFINIAITSIIVLSVLIIFLNKKVINKIYNENEMVNTENFNFSINNTYITNKNYNKKFINDTEHSYVIIKMYISPKYKEQKINTANIVLQVGDNNYTINQKKASNFSDIGIPYREQKISNNNTYIFIFNILNTDLNKKMLFTYGGDKKVNLKPINLDKAENKKEYKLNEKLDLSNTILSYGEVIIKSIDIKNKFNYSYQYEIDNKTYNSSINITSINNTIINMKLTSSLPNKLTIYELLSSYGKIKYKIDNEEYTSTLMNNKTPGSYEEGLYLEVDKDIEKATNIWLELTIREKVYNYILK